MAIIKISPQIKDDGFLPVIISLVSLGSCIIGLFFIVKLYKKFLQVPAEINSQLNNIGHGIEQSVTNASGRLEAVLNELVKTLVVTQNKINSL